MFVKTVLYLKNIFRNYKKRSRIEKITGSGDVTSSIVFALPYHHKHQSGVVVTYLALEVNSRKIDSLLKLHVFLSFLHRSLPVWAGPVGGRPVRSPDWLPQ